MRKQQCNLLLTYCIAHPEIRLKTLPMKNNRMFFLPRRVLQWCLLPIDLMPMRMHRKITKRPTIMHRSYLKWPDERLDSDRIRILPIALILMQMHHKIVKHPMLMRRSYLKWLDERLDSCQPLRVLFRHELLLQLIGRKSLRMIRICSGQ